LEVCDPILLHVKRNPELLEIGGGREILIFPQGRESSPFDLGIGSFNILRKKVCSFSKPLSRFVSMVLEETVDNLSREAKKSIDRDARYLGKKEDVLSRDGSI